MSVFYDTSVWIILAAITRAVYCDVDQVMGLTINISIGVLIDCTIRILIMVIGMSIVHMIMLLVIYMSISLTSY